MEGDSDMIQASIPAISLADAENVYNTARLKLPLGLRYAVNSLIHIRISDNLSASGILDSMGTIFSALRVENEITGPSAFLRTSMSSNHSRSLTAGCVSMMVSAALWV